MASKRPGGSSVLTGVYDKKIRSELICTVCLEVPGQGNRILECRNGHLLCQECHAVLPVRKKCPKKCPTCGIQMTKDKTSRCLLAEKMVGMLAPSYPCPYQIMLKDPCQEAMPLSEMPDHVKFRHGLIFHGSSTTAKFRLGREELVAGGEGVWEPHVSVFDRANAFDDQVFFVVLAKRPESLWSVVPYAMLEGAEASRYSVLIYAYDCDASKGQLLAYQGQVNSAETFGRGKEGKLAGLFFGNHMARRIWKEGRPGKGGYLGFHVQFSLLD